MRISDWSSDVCSSDLLRWDEREPFSGAAAHGLQDRLMADTAVARRTGMGLAEQQVAVAIDQADDTCRPDAYGLVKTAQPPRSEERRGGKEWGSTCRSRWVPSH